jgi:hypothetical protein
MNILSSLRRVAVVSACALFGAGCGGGIFATMNGYDAQSCAEASLRKGDAAGVGREAFELFKSSCVAEDAGACSALGVAYESGVGVERDLRAAEVVYERACVLENPRGCTNHALLETVLHPGDAAVAARSRAILSTSCDEDDRLACARLGRMARDGVGGPVDVTLSVVLFERSCASGDNGACMDLASSVGLAAPERATALYAQACTAGEPEACAALDASGARASGPEGTVASR